MSSKLFFFLSLAFSFLSIPAAASNSAEEASELFQQGIDAFNEGSYEDAAAAFRAANELNFNWKLLFNIAQSEAASKHNGLALQAFEEYVARGGDDIPMDRMAEVTSEIRRLRVIVGMLEIDGPKDATILINGEQRGVLPLTGPIMVTAGIEHVVKVVLDDKVLLERNIRLTGQQTTSLTVNSDSKEPAMHGSPETSPENLEATEPSRDSPRTASAKKLKIAGIVSMTSGGAIAAGGLVVGILGLQKANTLSDEYPDGIPASEKQAVDKAEKMALVSTIAVSVGGAAVATGLVLLIVHKKKKESLTTDISPVFGPTFAGFTVGGAF